MITFLAWLIGLIVGWSFVVGMPSLSLPLAFLIGVGLPLCAAAYGAILDAQW